MTEQRYKFIRKLNAELDALPDGAFFRVMRERGVSIEELTTFSVEFERRGDAYIKPKYPPRKL